MNTQLKFVLISIFVLATLGCKTGKDPANDNNREQSPIPTPPPVATPAPTPIQNPAPTPTPPTEIGGVPVSTHPLAFGYYYSDGKYGDFQKEVDCYTDLYYATAKFGYATSSDDPDHLWLPKMETLLRRAAANNKRIVLNLNLGAVPDMPVDKILDFMEDIWQHVYLIELADEPGWTKKETEDKLKEVRNKLRSRGLPDKPMGIVYTQKQSMEDDSIHAVGLDYVGLEAYVDAPGSDNSKVNVDTLNAYLKKSESSREIRRAKDRNRHAILL